MDKASILKWIDDHRYEYCNMSDKIWDFAELQYAEVQSSKLQMDYLSSLGFSIKKDLAHMPTAFMAQWGSGKPVIAFLGEYDALDGMSQEAGAVCYHPLKEKSSGHGCGHNLLGTAGVAAAAATKEYLCASKKSGTIRYYGCPAEEGGAGKTFMVREGCFNDVDIALTWHPSSQHMMFTTGTLANIQADFHFRGVSSHAAASPHMGRSALDALELMNVGVNFLREHIIPEARIHYAITDTGGTAPNIVQPEAEATYLVRAPSVTETNRIFQRVIRIAKGAAMMTDTQMTMRFYTAVSNYIPNMTLTDMLERNLRKLLPIEGISASNEAYMKHLRKNMPNFRTLSKVESEFIESHGYCGGLLPQDGSSAHASTDVGDVSWVVPTAQCEVACYAYGTPGHSWERTAQGKTEMAYAGMLIAAKAMALTACDIIETPGYWKTIAEEHKSNLGGEVYTSPIPADITPVI